jgi:hypothetical protein
MWIARKFLLPATRVIGHHLLRRQYLRWRKAGVDEAIVGWCRYGRLADGWL